MKITIDNNTELTYIISIHIKPEDYKERITSVLKKHQKTVDIKGFRRGMAPLSVVQKLFGKAVKNDELHKLSVETFYNHIKENNIDTLGEPILISEISEANIETLDDFTFNFEIGILPKWDINLSDIEVEKKIIIVDDAFLDSNIKNLRERYGTLNEFSEVSDKSLIYGTFAVLDENNNPTEMSHSTYLQMQGLQDTEAELKSKLLGLKLDEHLDFDTSMADKLKIKMWLNLSAKDFETVSKIRFTVNKIQNITPRDINKEFFDFVFPNDNIETEEAFREVLKKEIEKDLEKLARHSVIDNVLKILIEKFPFKVPLEYAKKVMSTDKAKANIENLDDENLEKELEKQYKETIIKNVILKNHKFTYNFDDIKNAAVSKIKQRILTNYGITMDDNDLSERANEYLKDENKYVEMVGVFFDNKISEIFNESVKIVEKEVTFDEYIK